MLNLIWKMSRNSVTLWKYSLYYTNENQRVSPKIFHPSLCNVPPYDSSFTTNPKFWPILYQKSHLHKSAPNLDLSSTKNLICINQYQNIGIFFSPFFFLLELEEIRRRKIPMIWFQNYSFPGPWYLLTGFSTSRTLLITDFLWDCPNMVTETGHC